MNATTNFILGQFSVQMVDSNETPGKERFNLRKLNIPPLRRDHSRSMDYSKLFRKSLAAQSKKSSGVKTVQRGPLGTVSTISVRKVSFVSNTDSDSKTTGRWTRDEHHRFLQGKLSLRNRLIYFFSA